MYVCVLTRGSMFVNGVMIEIVLFCGTKYRNFAVCLSDFPFLLSSCFPFDLRLHVDIDVFYFTTTF
jgi:hypothetical protein